jgi:hypothetical protein
MNRTHKTTVLRRAAALLLAGVIVLLCVPVGLAADSDLTIDEILVETYIDTNGKKFTLTNLTYNFTKTPSIYYISGNAYIYILEDATSWSDELGQSISVRYDGSTSYYKYAILGANGQLGITTYEQSYSNSFYELRIAMFVVPEVINGQMSMNAATYNTSHKIAIGLVTVEKSTGIISTNNIPWAGVILGTRYEYFTPKKPYDYWFRDYIHAVEVWQVIDTGGNTLWREYPIIKTAGNTMEQDIVNTITWHYGNRYPAYYTAYDYFGGRFIVLGKKEDFIIQNKGYIKTGTLIEPYYNMAMISDQIILWQYGDLIREYTTNYNTGPYGYVSIALPADEYRLSNYKPVYFNGFAFESFKTESDASVTAWGDRQEFTLWEAYETALLTAGEGSDPPIDGGEDDPGTSPEPTPTPPEFGEGYDQEAIDDVSGMGDAEIDLGPEKDNALSLFALVLTLFNQGTIGIGIILVIAAVVVAALIQKGRN